MLLRKISDGFRSLFRKNQTDRDLDDEVRQFVEDAAREKMKHGMVREEALREARLELGGAENVKEQVRAFGWEAIVGNLWRDVKFGLRTMRKNPGFTLVAAMTLALGIGANTALFSVANAFVFRPLPVKNAERLVVMTSQSGKDDDPGPLSYADYLDYKSQVTLFSGMTGCHSELAAMSSNATAQRVLACFVPSDYFVALGLNAQIGRLILPGEGDAPGTGAVVVLGYKYWQRQFGGDPAVTGRPIKLNGSPATIIGVAPRGFQGTYSVVEMDLYAPVGMIRSSERAFFTDRDDRDFRAIGTLKPGVSVATAQAEMTLIARRLSKQYPATDGDQIVRIFPERSARPDAAEAGKAGIVATVFLVLVGLVLLVACVNVASLLLARITSRRKELAVRLALGAGPWRLVRQVLVECLLLAILGALGGAVAGNWVCTYLGRLRPLGAFALGLSFEMDWRVFLYLATAAILAGVLAGVAPAVRAAHADSAEAIREGIRAARASERPRLRNALVVGQLAISMVVLVAAGLFTKNLMQAERVQLGFDANSVLDIGTDPALVGYDRDKSERFYADLLKRVRMVPGVESASLAYTVPMNYYNTGGPVYAKGHALGRGEKPFNAGMNIVSTGYFRTMRTRLVEGRDFSEADSRSSAAIAIVNQTMAQQMWPGEDAVGREFSYRSATGPFVRVAGVVEDTKVYGPAAKPNMYFYLPQTQNYKSIHVLQVRSDMRPEELIGPIEGIVRQIDPAIPVFDVMALKTTVNGVGGFFAYRAGAAFACALGAVGLVLAIVGVYGLVSYNTRLRTQELGIRVALGARPRTLLKLLLGNSAKLVMLGVFIGLLASLAITRFLSGMLIGVNPYDPLTFVLFAMLLGGAALAASYLPARRAMRVDPMVALRHE